MKFVLLVFNESLLILNQVENLCSCIFTSWIRVLKHVCEWNRFVPSAGFIISETCSMSFMYKIKSSGPNINPCGTPQEIS